MLLFSQLFKDLVPGVRRLMCQLSRHRKYNFTVRVCANVRSHYTLQEACYLNSSHLLPHSFQPNDSVAMINVSDDSEQEDEEYQPPPTPKTTTFAAVLPRLQGPTHTVAEPTPSTPPTQTRPFNLYLVAEDCAPPKDNEGIMYVRRGQIYDILDSASDWWLARLIKTVGTEGEKVCEQGWVPGSFLDKYEGKLSPEEEAAAQHGEGGGGALVSCMYMYSVSVCVYYIHVL